MKNTEHYFEFKKYDIFTQTWAPDLLDKDGQHLLIVHGLGEHSSSYANMAKSLTEKSITCHIYDLIGHGQSSGQRGYVPSFEIFVEQLQAVLEQNQSLIKAKKLSLFAHSMGGLIVLKSLYNEIIPKDIKIIFSNPLVNINVEIPEWKITLAQGLSQILPRFSLYNEINNMDLTKDEIAIENYSKDPLRHKKISVKLFLELQETTSLIQSKIKGIKNPALFMLSPNDKVCDSTASQNMAKNFSNCQLELFPQSGHEIINDLSKNKAFEQIREFVIGNK